jgi:PAS domain S-box-containing protein
MTVRNGESNGAEHHAIDTDLRSGAGPADLTRETPAQALRRRAKEKVRSMKDRDLGTLFSGEAGRLIEELYVHRIELEMQNEELRRAQEELEASQARYFDLFDLAPVGYVTVCERGLIVEANLRAAILLGGTRSALLKQPLTRFIVPEDQDIYYRHRKRLMAAAEPQACELRMARTGGATFWASITGAATQNRERGKWDCRITINDITDLKQAEEALRESEALLKQTQSIAHLGSWRLTIPSDVLTWSDETYRIFGIPQGAPLRLENFLASVHPDDRKFVCDAWNAALAGAPYDIEHRILVDSEVRWVRERAELSLDASGKPLVGIGVVQDITERNRIEEQLRIAAVSFECHNGMMVTDANTVIIQVNRRFTEITGWSAVEAVRKTPAILHSGRQDMTF